MVIQLFSPKYDVDACLAEIKECLDVGWTGMGFKTVEFEELWCEYTGLPHSFFLNSATAGLNMAVEILKSKYGWSDGDEIITTPFTFVSTNHAILLSNLRACFADIDEYLCLDPIDVEKKITPRTRAIIFVGFGGSTGNYQKIVDICKKYNLKLILDAAHMAGTKLNGFVPGKDADVVCYSFQAVKNLPTADSGIVCFKDAELDAMCRKIAWLGINKDTYQRAGSDGTYKWKYDVEFVGYKYHGNSIMAAIAKAQLPHLDEDNSYRRMIADRYRSNFSSINGIKMIPVLDGCAISQHLFQIIVDDRDGLLNYLNSNQVYPGVHYVINTEYRMYSYALGSCPNAEYCSNHILSLPIHLRMSLEDADFISSLVIKYIDGVRE